MLRLKLMRILSGQTQFEISRSASISQGRYSMIERGLIQPTADERKRLAQVLNAPAPTLFRPACRVRATSIGCPQAFKRSAAC